MEYKFQIENGNISEGSNTLYIKGGIATVKAADLTPAVKLLIEAHGGKLVEPEPEPKPKRRKVTKEAGD